MIYHILEIDQLLCPSLIKYVILQLILGTVVQMKYYNPFENHDPFWQYMHRYLG